jgi:hypothetical protein
MLSHEGDNLANGVLVRFHVGIQKENNVTRRRLDTAVTGKRWSAAFCKLYEPDTVGLQKPAQIIPRSIVNDDALEIGEVRLKNTPQALTERRRISMRGDHDRNGRSHLFASGQNVLSA